MEDKNQDTDLEGIDGQGKKVDYDPTKIEVDKEQIKEIPRSLFNFLKDFRSPKDSQDDDFSDYFED